MAFVIVIAGAVLVTIAVAVVTFVSQRKVASKMVDLDRELTFREETTQQCEACAGQGFVWRSPTGRAVGPETCWRCGGSGQPPTEQDRDRFLPSGTRDLPS